MNRFNEKFSSENIALDDETNKYTEFNVKKNWEKEI